MIRGAGAKRPARASLLWRIPNRGRSAPKEYDITMRREQGNETLEKPPKGRCAAGAAADSSRDWPTLCRCTVVELLRRDRLLHRRALRAVLAAERRLAGV